MKKKLKSIVEEYSALLKSVPVICTVSFVLSVILMNIMANKLLFQLGWLAGDCGVLVSWVPFLVMDILVKIYGPKAATKLNVFALLCNLFCVCMLGIAAAIPNLGYENFDYLFGLNGTWFILLASSIAFVSSGVINNFTNASIGKLFKNNPDGKVAYFTRLYVSTFIGQAADNCIFSMIAYWIFGNYFWGGAFFTGGEGFQFTLIQCVGAAVLGAVVELIMEVIFSPIGYKVVNKWKAKGVGKDYLEAYPQEV